MPNPTRSYRLRGDAFQRFSSIKALIAHHTWAATDVNLDWALFPYMFGVGSREIEVANLIRVEAIVPAGISDGC